MPNCPKCGAPLTLLSPDGTAWRCYNHGEANFHIDTPESRAAGAASRELSKRNAEDALRRVRELEKGGE